MHIIILCSINLKVNNFLTTQTKLPIIFNKRRSLRRYLFSRLLFYIKHHVKDDLRVSLLGTALPKSKKSDRVWYVFPRQRCLANKKFLMSLK